MGAWADFRADCERYQPTTRVLELSLWSIAGYRLSRFLRDALPDVLPVKVLIGLIGLVARILTTNDLPVTAEIGPGLLIYHGGNIVLNPHSRIGSGCTFRHGVTVGNRLADDDIPIIGDRVEMGAYAQVLGRITIGDDAKIGALSLVLTDVPAGGTAVGVPARVISPAL